MFSYVVPISPYIHLQVYDSTLAIWPCLFIKHEIQKLLSHIKDVNLLYIVYSLKLNVQLFGYSSYN